MARLSNAAREFLRRENMNNALIEHGMTFEDCEALLRISMTLHRWHELECGVENGGVERDEVTGKVSWYNSYTGHRSPYQDHETGALKRLAAIMASHPTLQAYVQGDPRGCALYIIRPGDVPEGQTVDSCYSRGIAIY